MGKTYFSVSIKLLFLLLEMVTRNPNTYFSYENKVSLRIACIIQNNLFNSTAYFEALTAAPNLFLCC